MQGRVGFANHGRFMRTLGGDMEKKMLTLDVHTTTHLDVST